MTQTRKGALQELLANVEAREVIQSGDAVDIWPMDARSMSLPWLDAPERIWTGCTNNGAVGECWYDATDDSSLLCGVEYVHTDIHDAMVAERDAMRAALQQVLHHCRNTGRGSDMVDARIVERCEDTAAAALAALP